MNSISLYHIPDIQHRMDIATFEQPPGWHGKSNVVWNFQDFSAPVKVAAHIAQDDGSGRIDFHPVQSFCWVEPNWGFVAQGQNRFGQVCLQPMSAQDTLIRFVLPRLRGNKQKLCVLQAFAMPQLGQMLKVPPVQYASNESICVRVSYTENGRPFEEEFFGIKVNYSGVSGPSGAVQYNWGFNTLMSVSAEAAQLDAVREIFWSVAHSFRVNPQWTKLYQQVCQQLQQSFQQYLRAGYDQINAATQLSRQVVAQNEAWMQQRQQQINADYEAFDRRRHEAAASSGGFSQTDAFGDMMMSRETYHDPYYSQGSQHYGYNQHVWSDGQGNYQYSDDANYNPNVNSSVQWNELSKMQVGQANKGW